MPTIAKLMNGEIKRLARKEARDLVAGVKKDTIRLKKDNADLKRRVAALEKENRQLKKTEQKLKKTVVKAKPEEVKQAKFLGKGVRSFRMKLGLSQDKFATLVGVSQQTVYNWESKKGALKLRQETAAKLLEVKQMGAREAKDRLTKIEAAAKARAGKKRSRKSKG